MLARCTNNGTIHHSQETLNLLRAQTHIASYKLKSSDDITTSYQIFLEDVFRDFVSKYRTSRMVIKSRTPNIFSSKHLHKLETVILLWILLTSIKWKISFRKKGCNESVKIGTYYDRHSYNLIQKWSSKTFGKIYYLWHVKGANSLR